MHRSYCPDFKLDKFDRPKERINQKMLYTKRLFNLPVKMENWAQMRDMKPVDNDPYCPGSVNLFLSHYNRLGLDTDKPSYVTETMDMLSQRLDPTKAPIIFRKKLIMSYMSYMDLLPCPKKNPYCPTACANDYVTTMQYSYSPPYPYIMERLSTPKTPFLKYRKLRHEDPQHSNHKFYDEGFPEITKHLREHKSDNCHKSYNPLTNTYNDGTPVLKGKRKCFPLEYRKDDI